MGKVKREILILGVFLVLGLLIRGGLVPLINRGDVVVNGEWSRRIYEEGVRGAYFKQGWTYSHPTQPPLMMFCFWTSTWLFEQRFVLAILHNMVKLPPANLLLWLDEYGEWLAWRWWGILGDLLMAVLVYGVIVREVKKRWWGLAGAALVIFNPVTLFVSGVWGQNGMWGNLFLYLAFFVLGWKWGRGWSPFLFLVGVMMKPTVVVVLPIYLVFVAREFWDLERRERGKWLGIFMGGGLAGIAMGVFSFLPFWEGKKLFGIFIKEVLSLRLLPAAKGTVWASVSAFNFHSLVFEIDRTLGSYGWGGLTLNGMGTAAVLVLSVVVGVWGWQRLRGKGKWVWLWFLVYVFGEGVFLFKTGMLERYFFPVFPASVILAVLLRGRVRVWLGLQNLIWLVNLGYAFFWRDVAWVNWWFRENNYLLVRVFSLLNLIVYFLILREIWGKLALGKKSRL